MSLWGAMRGSTLAMMAQTTGLETISENIANVSTTGFKKLDAGFKTLLTETHVKNDVYSVKPALQRRIDLQGGILSTPNDTDLAINGKGLFIVNTQLDGSGDNFFTRDGGFRTAARDVDGDSVQDSEFVTKEGYALMGWAADSAGAFPSSGGTLVPVVQRDNAVNAGAATSSVTIGANLEAGTTSTQTVTLPIYDNTFVTRNVNALFVPGTGDPNTWTLNFSTDAVVGTVTAPADGTTTLTFDGNGNPTATSPTTASVSVTWADATSSTFTVDISNINQLAGQTQVTTLNTDGHPAGTFQKSYFDRDGVLYYNYSNNITVPKYKVPLAVFPAPNLLEQMNGNTYRATTEAGTYTVESANVGTGFASFEVGAVERSNVDIGDEFTRMITTQKAYSMAATAFRTADEMVQVGRDLKR